MLPRIESEAAMSSEASRTPTAPARTASGQAVRDIRNSATFLPIEVGGGNGDDHFWLIPLKTEWHEAGRNCVQHQLWLRCRHCDFGYNSHAFVTVDDFVRMGQEAQGHVGECPRSGRTLELLSPQTGR